MQDIVISSQLAAFCLGFAVCWFLGKLIKWLNTPMEWQGRRPALPLSFDDEPSASRTAPPPRR